MPPRKISSARRRRRSRVAPEHVALACFAAGVIALWLGHRAAPPRPAPLSPAAARAANAAIPFAPGPAPPPRPFRFRGTPAAREQALACLATAALYEAGADPDGQRAVMQVVLNRVGRPGFAATVCGVVYQGATRPAGCQFSFACDGSATRRPERAGWAAARGRAARALSGATFRPVGTATHYHADYVVPGWIGSLDKTAAVGGHLFYRLRRGGAPPAR